MFGMLKIYWQTVMENFYLPNLHLPRVELHCKLQEKKLHRVTGPLTLQRTVFVSQANPFQADVYGRLQFLVERIPSISRKSGDSVILITNCPVI